jgi:hypothetical protein
MPDVATATAEWVRAASDAEANAISGYDTADTMAAETAQDTATLRAIMTEMAQELRQLRSSMAAAQAGQAVASAGRVGIPARALRFNRLQTIGLRVGPFA